MKNLWFTADTHFGHKKIPLYTKRYFCLSEEEKRNLDSIWSEGGPNSIRWHKWEPSWESIARMDDYLINKINEYVKEDDILWHLGDFCFAPKGRMQEYAQKNIRRINCKNIFLCWGNHDNKKISKFFKECHERFELKYKNKLMILSHYAQFIWNKSHNGSWMLYGHSHSTAENWLNEKMPNRFSMDVGLDNIYKILGEYRPISFEEINFIFSKRIGMSIDNSKN